MNFPIVQVEMTAVGKKNSPHPENPGENLYRDVILPNALFIGWEIQGACPLVDPRPKVGNCAGGHIASALFSILTIAAVAEFYLVFTDA